MPKAADKPKLSIVICYRDWGADRLEFAVRMHQRACEGLPVEVLISDYGSSDKKVCKSIAQKTGCSVVYTDPKEAPVWSRARALNAGVVAAKGQYIVTTDADILFSPPSYASVIHALDERPQLLLAQCRDLPENFSVSDLEILLKQSGDDFFDIIHRSATVRPRWGMGGLAAFHKDDFNAIRGYDERMEIYGVEDNDFAARMRKSGLPIEWLRSDEANIYHIYHLPTRPALENDQEGKQAIERNKQIFLSDERVIRNLHSKPGRFGAPLASIVIATRNRAAFIQDSIVSALTQTVQDIEVIVVDDGSTDETVQKCAEIQDPRLRVFSIPASGVARARNFATEQARARFIVIMDDDDIMLPTRVEGHFLALKAHTHGSYGGWIDFEDKTGAVVKMNQGRAFNYEALRYLGRTVVHAGLMMKKSILERYKYDENLKAGVDYNLLLKIARAGLSLEHTREVVLLRRIHNRSLTSTLSTAQKNSAIFAKNIVSQGEQVLPRDKVKEMDAASKPIGCVNLTDKRIYNHLPLDVVDICVRASVNKQDLKKLERLLHDNGLSMRETNSLPGVLFLFDDEETKTIPVEMSGFTNSLQKFTVLHWLGEHAYTYDISGQMRQGAKSDAAAAAKPAPAKTVNLFTESETAATVVSWLPAQLREKLPPTCILTMDADFQKRIKPSRDRGYTLLPVGYFHAAPDFALEKIFVIQAQAKGDDVPDITYLLEDSEALQGCLVGSGI